MAKYLDEDGLRYLWSQIDARFDSAESAISKIGYKIVYEDEAIKLLDSEDNLVGEAISAAPFIKDGMLDDVDIIEATETNPVEYGGETITEGKFIKFTWNVDGDNKVDYLKVTDIAVEPETDNTILSEAITVTGVTVGNLSNGTTIDKGKSLQEILQMILMKELDVIATKPTVSISNSGTTAGTYEVGTSISVDLSHKYTDGKFTGESGYSYSVAAGCEEGTTTYYNGSTALAGNTDSVTLGEGSVSYKCSTTYGASSVTPVTNFNNNSNITIAAGTANSSNITFTGKYKYFLGYGEYTTTEGLTSDNVRSLTVKSDYVTKDDTTTIVGSTAIKSNGKSIIIACPAKYKLATINNGLGANILDNFSISGTVDVNTGGGTGAAESYNVYIYPITNGAEVEFKNVTLTNA